MSESCTSSPAPATTGETFAPPEPGTAVATGRRTMLRAAAAAIGGAAAATVLSPRQATAADGDDLELGSATNEASSQTRALYSGGATSTGFSFGSTVGFSIIPVGMDYPHSTLGAYAGTNVRSGIRGTSDFSDGHGVVARNFSLNGGALHAQSRNGTAVEGEAIGNGTGVYGSGYTGITGESTEPATNDLAAGVLGSGPSGVVGIGSKYALNGFVGSSAALFLRTSNDFIAASPKPPPPERVDAHDVGEIDTDMNGDLWYCAVPGTPGTWLKLAGPSTAGSFHPLTPFRAYDSRRPDPSPGVLSAADDRVVSVKDSRLEATGGLLTADVVPAGAKAVAYNLAVTDTVGGGFLAIADGGAASTETAAINWSTSGISLSNAGIVQVDDQRQVKVFCGGGATNFVLDITGYWL